VFLVCCLVIVTQTLSVPTCVCLEERLASVTGVSRYGCLSGTELLTTTIFTLSLSSFVEGEMSSCLHGPRLLVRQSSRVIAASRASTWCFGCRFVQAL
jgi:hypothetical protein